MHIVVTLEDEDAHKRPTLFWLRYLDNRKWFLLTTTGTGCISPGCGTTHHDQHISRGLWCDHPSVALGHREIWMSRHCSLITFSLFLAC